MTDTFHVPETEIRSRLQRLQLELEIERIDALFVVQRVDLFYLTGTAQTGFLYVPARGEPVLFIKRFLPRALAETSLRQVIGIDSVTEVPHKIRDLCGAPAKRIGFEMDVLPVRDFNFYRGLLDVAEPVDGSGALMALRRIKSSWEIEQMEAAAALSAKTFSFMRQAIRPGLSEMEFAGMTETFARRHGHGGMLRDRGFQGTAYPWHVLSGENGGRVGALDSPASGQGTSAAFPFGAGYRRLRAAEPIMIDFGTVLNGYHADETRMFAIGALPDKARRACETALALHDRVIAAIRPGMTADALFGQAKAMAASLGLAETFLGPPGHKVHFIGHGIGAELVEPPIIARGRKDLLEPGMVLAIEPKLVYENEFSAGMESVVLVTGSGHRLLTRTPAEVFCC